MKNTKASSTSEFKVQSSEFKVQSLALSTPDAPTGPPPARYALRRDLGFWQLTFDHKNAILKHEQGIFYVAWLLHNVPEEPIHGVALALEVRALYGKPIDEA
jgi:hypothetical protein